MSAKKKKYPGGWEFDYWSEEVAYAEGDVVYFKDYLYKAAMATDAGDQPRSAMATFYFYDLTYANTPEGHPMATAELSLPKWVLWDLGNDYYHSRLRGVTTGPFDAAGRASTSGVRTLVVRNDFVGAASQSSDEHTYDNATQASYAGYGFPAGMTSEWEGGIYAPSMVDYGGNLGAPQSFTYEGSGLDGLIYQPSTCCPVGSGDGEIVNGVYYPYAVGYWDNGGLSSNPTIGGVFSIIQTFGRQFNGGDYTTTPFEDAWTVGGDSPIIDPTISTTPDYTTG